MRMNSEIQSIYKGMIMLWSGAVADIPNGWALCNGSNGTPDLRNCFIVGAGDTYNPAATGGATTHTHSFTTDGHTHAITYVTTDVGMPVAPIGTIDSNTDTGDTDAGSSLPPYYALAYIMKV